MVYRWYQLVSMGINSETVRNRLRRIPLICDKYSVDLTVDLIRYRVYGVYEVNLLLVSFFTASHAGDPV